VRPVWPNYEIRNLNLANPSIQEARSASDPSFVKLSFYKGIYLSIPFDLLLPRSHTDTATILRQPLLRDSGARFHYLTNNRNTELFWGYPDRISD
jgi:hypothetical protein